MEKKNLKWYEAPQMEIVEMEMQTSVMLTGSGYTEGSEDVG